MPEGRPAASMHDLPQPPRVPPRLRMHRAELVGMSVVALVPLLAIAGAFGPRVGNDGARAGALALEVRYPTLVRRGMTETLEARVTNRSAAPLSRLTLTLDAAYVGAFSGVAFRPDVERAHTVALAGVQPGETRLVAVELAPAAFGRHRGHVAAVAGRDSAVVALTTVILP